MIKIRIGESTDAPALLNLTNQLGYPLDLENIQAKLTIYLSDPTRYNVFIAELDKKVVGYAAVSIDELFVVTYKKMQIQAIVVDEQHQAKGIGKALMQKAEEYAVANNCGAIDLLSGMRRAASGTHDFYKSIGYHNEGKMAKLYLRKDL